MENNNLNEAADFRAKEMIKDKGGNSFHLKKVCHSHNNMGMTDEECFHVFIDRVKKNMPEATPSERFVEVRSFIDEMAFINWKRYCHCLVILYKMKANNLF